MIEGKTIFSWNVPAVCSGDPGLFARALFDAGFEGVCLKVADGPSVFKQRILGPWPTWGENVRQELVDTLKAFGLKVYFWHFLYGVYPQNELATAITQCERFKPDGYVWDVEGKFDTSLNSVANARLISKGLRTSFPEIPQALCWWALPKNPDKLSAEWHPVKVALAWMEYVDIVMPMMYWGGISESEALSYLRKSLKVWDSIGAFPMMPIGRAYTGDGGMINPVAISAFAKTIYEIREERDIRGISWWALDNVFKDPSSWKALSETSKFLEKLILDLSLLSVEEILARLVNLNSSSFPELYKKEI